MVRLITRDPISNRAQRTFVIDNNDAFTIAEYGVVMPFGGMTVFVPWSNVAWMEVSKAGSDPCDVCGLPWDHTHEVTPSEMLPPKAPEKPAREVRGEPGEHDHPVTPRKRGRPRKHG